MVHLNAELVWRQLEHLKTREVGEMLERVERRIENKESKRALRGLSSS